jgi:hypothetical protein
MRNNTALSWLLAAAFAALMGCGQQPSPEQAPIPSAPEASAACAAFAAKRVDPIFPEQPNPETQLALIKSLESRLSQAGEADVPGLLLELGRAKARFTPASQTPDFFYNEFGGDWLYNGHDFRELTRRFPNHDLADDAAYELTHLRQGGECEGWVPCYVFSEWEPVSTFLKAYPNSPLADTAVERALSAFAMIDTDKDLRAATDSIDPEDIRKLTASLEEVGRALPPARGGRLLLRAAELWEAASNYDSARNAYRAVPAAADPQVRACAAARLDGLSARSFTLHPARVIHLERTLFIVQFS